MKKSIKLRDLKVRSFATSTYKQDQLKGGSDTIVIDDIPDEPTGLGPSCEWTTCSAIA